MNNRIFCGLLLLILAGQSACIPFRKTARKTSTVDATTVAEKTADSTLAPTEVEAVNTAKNLLIETLTPVWKNVDSFSTFSGKAKMQYEGRGQKQEFTTVFRIKKDETIWASVIALGGIVQVARVMITPDSFKLINYLEKEIMMMPLSEASKVLPAPADFATLQNLVVGGVLRKTGTPTDATDLGNLLSLQVEEENFVQQINYNKADTTVQTLQMRTANTAGPSGIISFSNYQLVNSRKFPMNRNINVVNSGEQHSLEMSFNKADFDLPVDFPFALPKNYKRK